MGCWNKTCGITQFPLVRGDDTVNFILIETGYKVDPVPCHATGHGWALLPIPFYGNYDDYGWQVDDPDQQSKYDFLAEHFNDRIVLNQTQEKMERYYSNIKSPFANSSSLDMSIHRELWVIGSGMPAQFGTKTRKLASFTVSRIAWDAFTKKMTQTYPKRKVHTHSDITAAITRFYHYYEEQKLSMDDFMFKATLGTIASDYIKVEYDSGYGNPISYALRWAAHAESYDSSCAEFNPIEAMSKGVITAEDVASMYMFHDAMNSLRKTYQPQSHSGSQHGIDNYHSELIKVMQAIIKHDKTRWDD